MRPDDTLSHFPAPLSLQLVLRTDDFEIDATEILDVRYTSIWARFPRRESPLPENTRVRLLFGSPGIQEMLEVEALVQSRDTEPESLCYNFCFVRDDALGRRNAGRFFGLFNQRGAYRVRPSKHDVVTLRVGLFGAKEKDVTARLEELSATGLGAHIASEEASGFAHGARVELELVLPDASERHSLVATVRSRVRKRNTVRFGFHFDESQTTGFSVIQEAVVDYVMRRQREQLQGRG